jgi:hypothetical protein
MAMPLSRLVLLARRDPAAIDTMKTALRALPYTEYAVKEHNRTEYDWDARQDVVVHGTYLYGLSQDVTIPSAGKKFGMGPYQVWVPVTAFAKNGHKDYQFIPNLAPTSYYRTPHHHAGGASNPFNSGTCWGGFGGIVKSMTAEGDVPELFRSIYIYLSRYDAGSPLGGAHLNTHYFPFARVA